MMDVLRRLARMQLPCKISDQHEIDHLRVLQAARLVEVEMSTEAGHPIAIALGLTPKGRTVLQNYERNPQESVDLLIDASEPGWAQAASEKDTTGTDTSADGDSKTR